MNVVPTTRRRTRAAVLLAALAAVTTLSVPAAAATTSTTAPAPAPAPAPQPDLGVGTSPPGGISDAETGVEPEDETGAATTTSTTAPVTTAVEGAAVAAAAIGPPAVTVTPTTGLNPAGGSTITVAGTGFDPNANSKFGVYAVFGPVDPSTYFSDANRYLAAVWLHPGGGASGSPGQGELNPDGTFSATLPPAGGLPLTAAYTDGNGAAVNCMTTQCYVVTMAAHGVADRSMDTCTPVSFAGGTATPAVDRSCRPVAAPTGVPTGPAANGNTGANGSNTGANGTNTSGSGTGSTGSTTLPKTGSSVPALVALGLAALVSGLVLVHRDRRNRRDAGNSPGLAVTSGLDRSG